MTSLALVISSFAKKKEAQAVVHALLQARLIACGTLLPKAHSLYVWQGKIEETKEVVVLLKTSQRCLKRCMKKLRELHPYDVPEIIALEPTAVDAPYLQWVHEVLHSPQ